jgi:hypothetical protein
MTKILSFASWNVENFHGEPSRVERIVALLAEKDPDIFAIYEVRGRAVFDQLMDKMTSHSFFLTENTRDANMELLVGTRRTLPVFVTQREEFQSKVPTLRPGALATVKKDGESYVLLFLHTKSFPDPRSWGLRDDMFKHVASLKRKLDKNTPGDDTAKFVCVGDLNTMGLNATYNDISDLTAAQEIEFLSKRLASVNMRRLPKSHELSWWNGKSTYAPGSNLDHVFADDALKFKSVGDAADVEVVGWPQKDSSAEKKAWIDQFSDHALLYAEIHA